MRNTKLLSQSLSLSLESVCLHAPLQTPAESLRRAFPFVFDCSKQASASDGDGSGNHTRLVIRAASAILSARLSKAGRTSNEEAHYNTAGTF